jgi:sterol desaturase/sphingolipid hydroxylase (fatty acid hydroxylase superfamily)
VLADVVMLLIGISPNIASPVFHRWHHTAAERASEKNFAEILK